MVAQRASHEAKSSLPMLVTIFCNSVSTTNGSCYHLKNQAHLVQSQCAYPQQSQQRKPINEPM